MSALRNLFKNARKTNNQTERPIESKPSKPIVTGFMHGKNVIFKNSPFYKGMFGYVSDFFPAKYQVSLEQTTSVSVYKYPEARIGDYLEDGKMKVLNIIPELFSVKDQANGNIISLPAQYFARVIIYKTNGTNVMVGVVVDSFGGGISVKNVSLDGNSELTILMEKMNLDEKNSLDSLISKTKDMKIQNDSYVALVQKVSDLLKSGQKIEDIISSNVSKINVGDIVDEYLVVIAGPSNTSDVNLLGHFGKFQNSVSPQYQVLQTRQLLLGAKQIEKINNTQLIIRQGKYSSKTPYNYVYIPSSVEVLIESTGKKVHTHAIKINGAYQTQSITPKDLFYLDIQLKNGNYCEVVSVKENIIIVNERIAGKDFQTRTISADDIQKLMPGFRWTQNDSDSNLTTFSDPNKREYEQTEETEDKSDETTDQMETDEVEDEENTNQDYGDDDGDSGDDEISITLEEEPEMKSSFKDSDRLNVEQRTLTTEEQTFSNNIAKVLTRLKINTDQINLYSTIDTISNVVEQFEKQTKSELGINEKITKSSVLKYIVSCVVFYEIIKSGYRDNFKTFGLEEYVRLLFPSYFTVKDLSDLNSSILLKKWGVLRTLYNDTVKSTVQDMLNTENYFGIIKILVDNCDAVIQAMLNLRIPTEIVNTGSSDLITVGSKFREQLPSKLRQEYTITNKKGKKSVTQFYGLDYTKLEGIEYANNTGRNIYLTDLLKNNIPEKEVSIVWASASPLLQKYKMVVQQKINEAKTEKIRQRYEFVLKNLHRAPFAIRETSGVEKEYLIKIYDLMLEKMKTKVTKDNAEKQSRKRSFQEAKNTVAENRKRISLNKGPQYDSDNNDVAIEDTYSFKKEAGIREMKKAIANTNRIMNFSKRHQKEDATSEDTMS